MKKPRLVKTALDEQIAELAGRTGHSTLAA